jgi:PAS domain S-box-containing protein
MTSTNQMRSQDDAPIGVFIVDSRWTLIYVNAKALLLFQDVTDLIGRDFREFLPLTWPIATVQLIVKEFQQVLDTKKPHLIAELSDERIDLKQRLYYDLQIQPIDLAEGQSGIVCYVQDITRHIHAREEIEDSKRQFYNLAEAMPQMVWTANIDGGLDFTNRVMHEYTGGPPGSISGWKFANFLHIDDVERVKSVWLQSVTSGEIYEVDCRVRSKSGEYRWYLVRGLPVRDDHGLIIKWFGTCTDIQNERQASEDLEKRVEERTELLRSALAEAEQANILKSQFVSTISHEVRTPLSGIIGLAEYLTTIEVNPEVAEVAQQIFQASKQLLAILNDFLDFSKLEAGKVGIDYVTFDFRKLMQETQVLFEHDCTRKGIYMKTKFADEIPVKICADEQKIRQLLTNLLNNAVKFTEKGGINIRANLILSAPDAKSLHIAISDTGIGINTQAQKLLFQPFTQADGSMTRRFGGTGLGLSICKRYVDVLGGEIGFESTAGKGSTFWFNVPFRSEDTQTGSTNH